MSSGHIKHKVRQCRFFIREGGCQKGDECTFLHDKPHQCPSCDSRKCMGKQCKVCNSEMIVCRAYDRVWIPAIKRNRKNYPPDVFEDFGICAPVKNQENTWRGLLRQQPVSLPAGSIPLNAVTTRAVQGSDGGSYFFSYVTLPAPPPVFRTLVLIGENGFPVIDPNNLAITSQFPSHSNQTAPDCL